MRQSISAGRGAVTKILVQVGDTHKKGIHASDWERLHDKLEKELPREQYHRVCKILDDLATFYV